MTTAPEETELSKALDTFYVLYHSIRINHQGDMLTYEIGKSESAVAFSLDEAKRIIKAHRLPLKAKVNELVDSPHNILLITAK